jgi:dTDP-4-dehydrorhamnose reductase
MKVAILGTNGVLGRALMAQWPGSPFVVEGFGGRKNVNNLIDAIHTEHVNVLINAAGRIPESMPTDIEAVEANARLPLFLGGHCQLAGVAMYHVSTDCVYGVNLQGEGPRMHRAAYDVPIADPGSIYSMTKLIGERAFARIIRTSFADPEHGFWRHLRALSRSFSPDHDRRTPEFEGWAGHLWSGSTAPEAARAIWRLVQAEVGLGTYHVATLEPISKADAAEAVWQAENLNVRVVRQWRGSVDRSMWPTTPECAMRPFAEAIRDLA